MYPFATGQHHDAALGIRVYISGRTLVPVLQLLNVSFGTTARCVDYAGVHVFKCPD